MFAENSVPGKFIRSSPSHIFRIVHLETKFLSLPADVNEEMQCSPNKSALNVFVLHMFVNVDMENTLELVFEKLTYKLIRRDDITN